MSAVLTPAAMVLSALVTAAAQVSLDLTPIIVALMGLLGVLVTAGYIGGRVQKNRSVAAAQRAEAEARLADGKTILTHAQYEGFIAEAAQRLETVNKAAISRLEAELAKNQARIAELETELERAKSDRNEALAGAHLREQTLQQEISELRRRVLDLERRLEARGARPRRHGDRSMDDDDPAAEERAGGP